MDIQRLRNLTTGILHTEIGHVYQDVEAITGAPGVMTHMLPAARSALLPWLHEKTPEPRLWNRRFDQGHTGEIAIPAMSEAERAAFWRRFEERHQPLGMGKTVVVAV